MDLFPDADEFEAVAVPHPTVDQRVIPKLFGHVGEGDVVLAVLRDDGRRDQFLHITQMQHASC